MSVSIEFPLTRRWSALGPIVEPKILVEVRTLAGYRGRHFLVDTGAACSAAPRRLAQQVGHDWGSLPSVDVSGIGRGNVQARVGLLQSRLGGIELSVRCLFVDQVDAPLVLGCADVLDRFALTIDSGLGKVIFTDLL